MMGVDIWKRMSHVLWLFRIFKMYFLFYNRFIIYYKCYISNNNKRAVWGIVSVLLHLWLLKMCRPKECSCGIMKEGRSLHLPSKGPSEIKQTLCFCGENNSKCRLHSYSPKCCKHACIHKYLWGFLTLFRFVIKTNPISEMFLRWGLDVTY